MIEWCIFLFCLMLAISVGQAIYVVLFARAMRRYSPNDLADDPHPPHASIILCVRGKDPSLEACLSAVAHQDYPSFSLHIMLDHESDPAAAVVKKFAAQHENVQVNVLRDPLQSCSLKCNSLIQAIGHLEVQSGIVALLDADTAPHPKWLSVIARHLSQDSVGVVSGIRCYTPIKNEIGSLVRYQWNSAAAVQMFLYKIPWGGTLAFDYKSIDAFDLVERWSLAFCEDTMLKEIMQRNGKQVCIVPALVMPNKESCRLRRFIPWVSRQLLTARLYHPSWPLVVIHAATTSLAMLATIVTGLAAILTHQQAACIWSIAAFMTFQIPNWLMLLVNDASVRHQLAITNQETNKAAAIDVQKMVWHWLLIPLTQCVYLVAVISAAFTRKVKWRQIKYSIRSPFEIERRNYAPYQDDLSNDDSL